MHASLLCCFSYLFVHQKCWETIHLYFACSQINQWGDIMQREGEKESIAQSETSLIK